MEKLDELGLKGKLVLDAGTGACGMTEFLEKRGADVVSIDLNKEFMEECRNQLEKANFIRGNLSELQFIKPETFDHVMCKATVSALSENITLFVSSVFREFYRVLKDDGQLTIIDYYPFNEETSPCALDEVQVGIWRLEKAVYELLGESHLEEYPPQMIEDELKSIGFAEVEESIRRDELPWSDELLGEHEELIEEKIEEIEENYLREALTKKLRELMELAKEKKVESGAMFELRAQK
ncbi:MAG: class I SAM-dependent methyltransferase [Candidatus Thermoplasmatota archaeon]|nr:class I SAM-dependent methyltransferase [Candidatus Thermoplasmatota archaeon]